MWWLKQIYKPEISNFWIAKNVNKGNAKRGISHRLKIWPGDLDLWLWKSMEFQILLSTKLGQNALKDVDSRVFTRMLHKDGRTVALLYPFATSLSRG
jgi:hypothetical protein